MEEKANSFIRLVEIMAKLRSEHGCPWDKEQTKEKLKSYLVEETYEVLEAIDDNSSEKLKEELGDLLFSAANLSRFLKVNPEEALEKATKKFIERFKRVEAELASQGKEIGHASLEEMDRLWEAVKRQ